MIYNFAERLKELREGKSLSQEDVAKILGVTRATISGYECNNAQPPIDVLVKLASLYGCSTDYILGLDKRKMVAIDDVPERKQKLIRQILSSAVELYKE